MHKPGPKSGHNLKGEVLEMGKGQMASASIETLNARREQMVNLYGITGAQARKEWQAIDREVESRKTYEIYENAAWNYTRLLEQYQPAPYASDGQ